MESPILVNLLIHKAICNEFDALHQLAMELSMGQNADVGPYFERFSFLKSIYEKYSNATDEVIFAAVNARVKNIAPTYFLQHNIGAKTLFDHVFKLLISSIQNEETFPKELAFSTRALQTMVGQYMAKEEEQKFSHEEQAFLVWKLLCSIPTNVVAKFLPWLASSISPDEFQDLRKGLREIVPQDKLLQQVFFGWMEGKDSCASTISHQTGGTCNASEFTEAHPIDDVLLWHRAIERELNEALEEAKKMHIAGAATCDLSTFYKKLQFITEICIFHSVAESNIIYPAVYGENLLFQEHAKHENLLTHLRCLIESIQKAGEISSSSAELNSKICSRADQIMENLKGNFADEEVQVIPLVRKNFSVKRQRELLHESLCVMPLKLIERALPWLVNSLTANEANNFVKNMQLTDPASDIDIVRLFCRWASKPTKDSFCPSATGCCPIKRLANWGQAFGRPSYTCSQILARDVYFTPYQESNACNPSKAVKTHTQSSQEPCCIPGSYSMVKSFRSLHLNSSISPSHLDWVHSSFSASGLAEQPIDVVFKVHKAVRRDLEYLEEESERLSNSDDIFLQQFSGCFSLLWRLYRAHSNAEDCIVYPALECRDVLQNVSHSYTLDNKQEEQAFEDISGVLFELSRIHGSESSDCLVMHYELAVRLRGMFKSLRIMVDQHMSREEVELWPLFAKHFSVEEQNKMVGFILGTTGADVLQSMLPWVTSALTEDEQSKMMNTVKQVTKNTMFIGWLNDCWNGTSVSTSLTENLQTRYSPEGSLRPLGGIFKSDSNHNLKNLMTSYWTAGQQSSPQALAGDSFEASVGRSPTFRDHEKRVYGCKHYKRNCKLLAACCGKLFTCRFCHDINSDHKMDGKATTEMMCMCCLNMQPLGPICSTPSCNGFAMAKYCCNTCKLFDDDRNVYHCPFCNLCRVGKGLGVDYFHCMTCNCCLNMSLLNHKCQKKCLETNCPICNEFLFTSISSIRALPCGHYMHSACLKSHNSCLVCSKSSGDMKMESTQTSILVDGDEHMEFFHGDQTTQMKTSGITNTNLERRFSGRARFWENMLDHSVLRFQLHTGERPCYLQRLKKRLENAVAGQKAKERLLLCFLVLCILVLFSVLTTVLILVWFKALGRNSYIYLW